MERLPSSDKELNAFVEAIENKTRREDAYYLIDIFRKTTGQPPEYWPPSIIGFGSYHYKYESGREGDSITVGFSPRKSNLVLYVMGSVGADHPLMSRLGKHKTGKACLYINKLADIDVSVLEDIIKLSYQKTIRKYG